MAKLGEAYVQVRADLKPFQKDLDLSIKRLTDRFERDLNRQLGKKLGTNIGSGAREGIRESMNGIGRELDDTLSVPANRSGRRSGREFKRGLSDELKDRDPITRALASLTAGIEDGFSALPAEVKATVGAAILAAVIPAGALLTAAIGSAIVAGVALGGIALATQFTEVQERWDQFTDRLRVRFVNSAQAFGSATINALNLFEDRLTALDPVLKNIFDRAAQFVVPLADAVSRLVEEAADGLMKGLNSKEIDEVLTSLVDGFEYIGISISDAFEVLLTNPNLDVALYDLLLVIGDLVTVGAEFLNWTLDVYDNFKDVVEVVGLFIEDVWQLYQAVDALVSLDTSAWDKFVDFLEHGDTADQHAVFGRIRTAAERYNDTIFTTLSLTKEQEKAQKELNRAYEESIRNAERSINVEIAYQQSIDDVTAALKESKGSIDLDKQAGRDAATEIEGLISNLRDLTQQRLKDGKLTEAQAEAFYRAEIKRLRDEFVKRGGNLKLFDELFAKYAQLAGLPPIPDPFDPLRLGALDLKEAFAVAEAALARLLKKLPKGGNIKVEGGTQLKYADGGFVNEPTSAIMGENFQPEVVLPLSKPKRSLELLAKSPLADVLGGGATIVYAFFDGEPFQARIVRTAQNVSQGNARTLASKPRSI